MFWWVPPFVLNSSLLWRARRFVLATLLVKNALFDIFLIKYVKKKAFWSARFSYEQPSRGHSLEVCVQVQDFQKRFGFHLRFLQRFRKNINFHPFSSQLGTFTSYARNNLCDKSTVSVSFGFGEVNVLDVPNLMMSVFWVCDSLGNFTSETSH